MSDKRGKIFVISGPSGVGKSTIVKAVCEKTNVDVSVSLTTRPQGKNETDGKDYWFVSREEFQKRIDNGMLLEYAEVFDNMYGTPRDKIEEKLAKGESVILEIDTQGGLVVKEEFPDAVMIFILPPKTSSLEERMQGRGRESDKNEDIKQKRLDWAGMEIAKAWQFYEHMVINEKLETAINEVIEIIEENK